MLSTCPHEFRQKSFHIKHDDSKLFSRLLSKESSAANPSLRVYYGDVSGAVPFTWETRPGTPKHTLADNSLPPLTPPPSYYSHSSKKVSRNKHPRSKLLCSLLVRINLKKARNLHPSSPSSSSLSSVSWSSSISSFSGAMTSTTSDFLRSRGSTFDDIGSDHQHQEMHNCSLNSRFCFGMRRDRSIAGNSMKKTLLSIIGRGSD